MFGGPIGPVSVLQSAILIVQHFIKTSRWVSKWEEAIQREREGWKAEGERQIIRGGETRWKSTFWSVCVCVFMHAVSLTAVGIFVLSVHACISVLSLWLCLLSFVTLDLPVMCCVHAFLCACVCKFCVGWSACLCTWLTLPGCLCTVCITLFHQTVFIIGSTVLRFSCLILLYSTELWLTLPHSVCFW